jgi:hypothetical protein
MRILPRDFGRELAARDGREEASAAFGGPPPAVLDSMPTSHCHPLEAGTNRSDRSTISCVRVHSGDRMQRGSCISCRTMARVDAPSRDETEALHRARQLSESTSADSWLHFENSFLVCDPASLLHACALHMMSGTFTHATTAVAEARLRSFALRRYSSLTCPTTISNLASRGSPARSRQVSAQTRWLYRCILLPPASATI